MNKEQRLKTPESLLVKLVEHGLLLQQDKNLPNIVSFVTGEVVRGSWWSHPDAQTIYECLNTVVEHPDVLVSKLVLGKVTFVHRRLWSSILAMANSHDLWQFENLSEQARNLYGVIEQNGTMLSSGQKVKELEQRLLVHSEQVHTESGRHETQIETWMLWAERVNCQSILAVSEGKFQLETAVRSFGGKEAMLPWYRYSGKA
ncbi:hypothetical protein IQ268_12135 [Oculatella sp. LEGE 06141]|uniref:AlkZ-related protein n=1 Tax=Oculatella sp. LEGE 06141 TaxID=1828648 RepID=UPI00187E0998|nr:hypothetical protein [Oculatella sp. LEGE 06141]MBE9179310.1 hypothetical protein [Oculatella sp. LEGE 06141]